MAAQQAHPACARALSALVAVQREAHTCQRKQRGSAGKQAHARARATRLERGQRRHAPRRRRGALWGPAKSAAVTWRRKARALSWRMAARNELRLRRASPSDLFRAVFSACAGETPPLVLDVRPRAAFARGHVAGSYCVRASANGAALLDYSGGGGQARPWAQGVWHDASLLLLGDGDTPLDERHPVVAFIVKEGAARALSAVKGGYAAHHASCVLRHARSEPCLLSFAAVAAEYPFVSHAGGSVPGRYPSEVLPRQLYLGDWGNAEQHDALRQLGITHLLTIHNVCATSACLRFCALLNKDLTRCHQMPETLRAPPAGVTQLRQVLADVETEDVASHFPAAVAFISSALEKPNGRVLVHCGAGVSRSAALVAAYLIATRRVAAARAVADLQALRSCVAPNAGFLRQLDAFAKAQQVPIATAAATAAPGSGSGWLEVSKDGALVARLPLPSGSSSSGEPAVFTVGRAPGCGLALEHPSVSRAHASLVQRGAAWWLRDAGSAHGTWLDGARLAPGAEAQLRDGAVMRFGASSRSVAFRDAQTRPPQKRRSRSRSRSRSPQRRRH